MRFCSMSLSEGTGAGTERVATGCSPFGLISAGAGLGEAPGVVCAHTAPAIETAITIVRINLQTGPAGIGTTCTNDFSKKEKSELNARLTGITTMPLSTLGRDDASSDRQVL